MSLLDTTADHPKHFTVTGYVMNKPRTKLLLVHHNKLDKWLPAGGHLETDELPHAGAIREVLEETGVRATVVGDEPELGLRDRTETQIPRPYALMYQLIPAHGTEPEHIHLDMVFALEANEAVTSPQLIEVRAVRWMTRAEILELDTTFDSVKGFAQLNLVC